MGVISLFEARQRVLAAARPLAAAEDVPLASALGRRLAGDMLADGPWPATDRSAMDGFAVAAGPNGLAAGSELPVVGESLAGRPFAGALPAGAAIRIMTGAVVPPGADAVIPVEQTSGFAGERVVLRAAAAAGDNVRSMGSEWRAGQRVLAAGMRIDAAAIGALAVLGRVAVPVARRARVAIVATGDEVVPVEAVPAPHQVRESNSWALAAQVAQCGGEAVRLGVAPDEAAALRGLLGRAIAGADVVVTIGGISQGTHDLVHDTLAELGVATVFHGVALKPGKPTFFGTRSAGEGARWVFGLPGNPASCYTVFDLLVRPLLAVLHGGDAGTWGAALPAAGRAWRANARWQAVPARLCAGPGDGLALELLRGSPSGDPFALLGAEVYALVPADTEPGAGVTVRVVGSSSGAVLP